jgi:hypothetical protein
MSRARDIADGKFSGAVVAASADFTGTVEAADLSDGTTTVGTEYVTNGSAKAWARTDGTTTPALADSFNVASVTDDGVGDITLTYTAGFSVSPCSPAVGQMGSFAGMQQIISVATSSVRVKVHDSNGNAADPVGHHVSSFGDLA